MLEHPVSQELFQDGDIVALPIDKDTTPYQALSDRGRVRTDVVETSWSVQRQAGRGGSDGRSTGDHT